MIFVTAVLLLLLWNQNDPVREAYQSGEAAIQQGNLAAAEKDFNHVLELVPQDVGARVNLGVIFMREEKWDKALDYLKQAEKLAPQVAGIRLNVGLVHYRQGQYAAAIPEFESVLKQQPDSAQAQRLLGLCYLFKERYADAARQLEPLWPASNGDISYLYSLAVAAGHAGRHDLEERAMSQLLATGQDSPLLHLLMGKAYLAREDYAGALTELRKAEQADAALPMLHYNLGLAYRHAGDTEKAKAEFLAGVKQEPNVPYNYDQLGLLASEAGNHREAEACYRDAVKRDQNLGTAWFGLAKACRQLKLYPEALEALRHAGDLDPNSASVHYLRAQVLAQLGRNSEAQAEFATVQRLKKEGVDKLEQEITGAKYHDPDPGH
jgi:tetratricopeptide (TPR) repeat protein